MQDHMGRLPLHYAAAAGWHASAEVLAVLLGMHPEAAAVEDNRGELPLHLAAAR